MREELCSDYSLKSDGFDLKMDSMKLTELLGYFSGMGIFFIPFIIYFLRKLILILIAYILLIVLQFFSPLIKKLFESKKNNSFEELKKNINEITKTHLYFENERKKNEELEDMEFELKNCIDISGEIDMTKPPEFYWEKKKIGK